MDPPVTQATPMVSSRAPILTAMATGSSSPSAGVTWDRVNSSRQFATQPQFRAAVSDRFFVGHWVSLPESVNRKSVHHAGQPRHGRELRGRVGSEPERVLDCLHRRTGVGWRAAKARRGDVPEGDTPGHATSLSDCHHATGHVRVEDATAPDPATATDFSEISCDG